MAHFFLIDPLENLNIKKDSSLLLALAAQSMGLESYIVFASNFWAHSDELPTWRVHSFDGLLSGFYIDKFNLHPHKKVTVKKGDHIHMRLDPPVDETYLSFLWMLQLLQSLQVRIHNDPTCILQVNEKIHALKQTGAVASWIGPELALAKDFLQSYQDQNHVHEFILKPLNGFSGIGVEKFHYPQDFQEKCKRHFGKHLIIQPFLPEVASGEKRAIFCGGKLLGSILKVPAKGEFLSNIAQGAKFHQVPLSTKELEQCEKVSRELAQAGISFIAFDILAERITEANVTCPGLVVEVSHAMNKNIAVDILQELCL